MKFVKSLFLVASLVLFASSGQAASICADLFADPGFQLQSRLRIVESLTQGQQSPWIQQLFADSAFIYKGKHKHKPGTDFLASNEFDWYRTPYSKKKADLLVAFGTNSAWEIIIAQSPKHVVIADWSPNPLIGQAYVIAPLMKIAQTPQEFIMLLSGRLPEPGIEKKSVSEVFDDANSYLISPGRSRQENAKALIANLVKRRGITEKELSVLTSYFLGMTGVTPVENSVGPFEGLRVPVFANFLKFYGARYGAENIRYTSGDEALGALETFGSLANLKNFRKLRRYFIEDRIRYAMTSVNDTNFYSQLMDLYRPQGLRNMVLSVTNIFDCGDYNQMTFQHYQALLKNVASQLQVSPGGPSLTVYRTTNVAPPHGFYRYEIDSIEKVPQKDEDDSQATQGPAVKLDPLKSAG